MKKYRKLEIGVGSFAITFTLAFLVATHFMEEESGATEIFNLPEESVSVDKQPTKYKRFDVQVKLTKYQLEKMLQLLEEKNGYYDKRKGLYIHALPEDYMTFRSVATGGSKEYEISSTQLSRYTGGERIEQ
jgi:hypothetical protein